MLAQQTIDTQHRRSSATPRATCPGLLGALLLLSLASSGCYRYVPVQPAAVRSSEQVQVRITESAAVRLVKEFGAFTGQLEGLLAIQGADSLSVSVNIGREYRGMALENARQTLFLERGEVVEIRRRQLSRGRTALATAGALVVFGVLVNSVVLQGDPNTSDDNPPPPPPGVRRLYLRVPIR